MVMHAVDMIPANTPLMVFSKDGFRFVNIFCLSVSIGEASEKDKDLASITLSSSLQRNIFFPYL
jgi:hypothetical protein